jgi:hypothetical protein
MYMYVYSFVQTVYRGPDIETKAAGITVSPGWTDQNSKESLFGHRGNAGVGMVWNFETDQKLALPWHWKVYSEVLYLCAEKTM